MLPRRILSLLADDCGLYHHVTSVASSPFLCSTVSSLHGRDVDARSSTTRPRIAYLVDGAGPAEGAPSRLRCSPASMRAWPPMCGALARLLTPCGHRPTPTFLAWLGQRRTNKFLLASSPCKFPAAVHLAAHLHPCVRARAVCARSSASRHLEPSYRSRCWPYKRDPPCHLAAPHHYLPP
jgi:hypothetical protein